MFENTGLCANTSWPNIKIEDVDNVYNLPVQVNGKLKGIISIKIDEKSSPTVTKTTFATKIDKKSLPGTPWLAMDRFFVNFGVPAGTSKWLS